jgi:hypothetical protein
MTETLLEQLFVCWKVSFVCHKVPLPRLFFLVEKEETNFIYEQKIAHAKLMLRDRVLVMDAVIAITLVECSLNRTATFGNVNILHTSFPEDAEIEYRTQSMNVKNMKPFINCFLLR